METVLHDNWMTLVFSCEYTSGMTNVQLSTTLQHRCIASYALCQMVIFPMTLSDPNHPKSLYFFYILHLPLHLSKGWSLPILYTSRPYQVISLEMTNYPQIGIVMVRWCIFNFWIPLMNHDSFGMGETGYDKFRFMLIMLSTSICMIDYHRMGYVQVI